MPQVPSYRIDVAVCPANPRYYRWTVTQDGQPLDLPGYAYASAWSAREAARVALHWHCVLGPSRVVPASPEHRPVAAARAA